MLTETEIKRFIAEDYASERKILAREGQRYYEGEHDILNYRLFYYNADGVLVEDKTRSNVKITHPFFTELVDQLASYMLSGTDNPIRAKDASNGLQEELDIYFDDEFWAEVFELLIGTNSKGFDYMYGYKNVDDRIAFKYADSMGVVEVRAKDTDDGCDYVIYWYIDRIEKGKKLIKRIQVHTPDEIHYFVQVGDGKVKRDENEPHNPAPSVIWRSSKDGKLYGEGLGYIPFWRLDNNRKQFSGLKPIKALIDDYDLMECGLSNNLQDFDTPIHVISGFQGDNLDELQKNLKTKKIIGVDEGGAVDIKTVEVPYQARKTKADEDEKNIYRFGMGFNSSQVGDGNVTNIVIRSRYTLLELKAEKLTKRLKKFLKGIIKVVLDDINSRLKTDYTYDDVIVEFERKTPTNATEDAQKALTEAQTRQLEINNVLNVASLIGDDEVLKLICELLDIDYEEIKDAMEEQNAEQSLTDAQNRLNEVNDDEDSTTVI